MPIGLLGDLRVFHQNQVSAPQVWNSPLFSKDPGVQGKVREHPAQMPWVPVVNTVLDGEAPPLAVTLFGWRATSGGESSLTAALRSDCAIPQGSGISLLNTLSPAIVG